MKSLKTLILLGILIAGIITILPIVAQGSSTGSQQTSSTTLDHDEEHSANNTTTRTTPPDNTTTTHTPPSGGHDPENKTQIERERRSLYRRDVTIDVENDSVLVKSRLSSNGSKDQIQFSLQTKDHGVKVHLQYASGDNESFFWI